jgi:molecular chaperone DnaK (HSP70)
MSIRDKEKFVVIGIDFGTTYSGFTYAFSEEEKVYDYKEWDDSSILYAKTKTQLLYINGKPEYWGHTAVIEDANRHDSQAEIYRIFNFKMQLSQQYYQYPGIPEKKFLVIDLVSEYLKFIKDKALEIVRDKTIDDNIEDRIIWCLTVPSIWTDEQKNKMRTAAIKAGMISNSDDDYHKLILVYEPEAAAVYCRQKGSVGLDENDCYMIVDCGGGTVDITTRVVNKKNDLLVLNAIQGVTVDGGPYGSTYVDKKFMTFLSEKITPKALDDFHERYPREFLHIYQQWEKDKIILNLADFKNGTAFRYPDTLRNFLKKTYPNIFEEIVESEGSDTTITIEGNELAGFFTESLNGLVDKVEKQFQKLKDANRKCDYIILVGGYSNCPLLKETIQKKFSSKVKKIIQDSNPGAAVVEGATWLGLNPNLNATRTSNLTYGVDCLDFFKSGDPEAKKIKILGKPDYCDDILLTFVKAGELVEIDKAVYHNLSSINPDQTVLLFKFYSTKETNVRHINSQMTLHGDKKFTREDAAKGKNWTMRITMYFGRSEIEVVIEDMTTHEIKRLKLDFRCTF